MLVELQGIMDRDMKNGAPLFQVWQLEVSDQVQALAVAYVERVVLSSFCCRIQNETDAQLAPVLERLAVLFALDSIEKEMGFYLTNHLLTVEEGKDLYEVVRQMCGKGPGAWLPCPCFAFGGGFRRCLSTCCRLLPGLGSSTMTLTTMAS